MHLEISLDLFIIALFLGLLVLAAINDVAKYRIPNHINLAIAALYPAHVLASPHSIDWIGGLIVATTMLALGVVLFVLRLMGGGDVKMIAATALWAGPLGITIFILVTAVAGALIGVTKLTPVRNALAVAFARFTATADEQPHHTKVIPYGLAIALGGFAVGSLMLGSGRIL